MLGKSMSLRAALCGLARLAQRDVYRTWFMLTAIDCHADSRPVMASLFLYGQYLVLRLLASGLERKTPCTCLNARSYLEKNCPAGQWPCFVPCCVSHSVPGRGTIFGTRQASLISLAAKVCPSASRYILVAVKNWLNEATCFVWPWANSKSGQMLAHVN